MSDSLLADISPSQLALLKKYSEAIEQSPSWFGMTAANERSRFWKRHVLDALAMVEALPPEWRGEHWKVADAGTGNGVPGLPIAIVIPKWDMHLIDSDNKKVGFLEQFSNSYSIKSISYISERLEVFCHTGSRETFNLVFARALSKLRSAIELTAPLVKVGGRLIVSHGTSWPEELEVAKKAMRALGVEFERTIQYGTDKNLVILVFSKKDSTPSQYPRRTGVPSKKPL
ncbi:MAG: 16S rRNA (guanine(527)-N(7))-methyltransferase RsmG [Elusimicrobiota bacterium]|jgi:16S rRNA (guanine527-N7)-methyltransferase